MADGGGVQTLASSEYEIAKTQNPSAGLTLRQSGAKRVYDMGCGLGRHTIMLAENGFSVVASDISFSFDPWWDYMSDIDNF